MLAFYHKLASAKLEVKINSNAVHKVTIKMKCFTKKKRLLLRCIHHLNSDVLNNTDHMRIIIF